jgi:hypothetical protein
MSSFVLAMEKDELLAEPTGRESVQRCFEQKIVTHSFVFGYLSKNFSAPSPANGDRVTDNITPLQRPSFGGTDTLIE